MTNSKRNIFANPIYYLYFITIIILGLTIWKKYDIDRFYESHNFEPLLERFEIKKDFKQSYQFSIDYPGSYELSILFSRTEPPDTIWKYSGTNFTQPQNNDTSLHFDLKIFDQDNNLYSARITDNKAISSHSTKNFFGRDIFINFFEVGTYILELSANKTSPILNNTFPQIQIKCIDFKYADYSYSIIKYYIILAIFIGISIFVMFGQIIIRIKNKTL